MTQPQKNTLLVCAIVAGLVSLPMTWMTLHNAQIQGAPAQLGELFGSAFQGITISVTGLNGHVTFLFQTPIWFIVCVAIAAGAMQLMRGSKMFAIPPVVEWVVAIIAVAWIGIAVAICLFSGQATPGIGLLLGLFCAAAPVVCLAVRTSEQPAAMDGEE